MVVYHFTLLILAASKLVASDESLLSLVLANVCLPTGLEVFRILARVIKIAMEQVKKRLAQLKEEKEAALERAEEAEREKKEAEERAELVRHSKL